MSRAPDCSVIVRLTFVNHGGLEVVTTDTQIIPGWTGEHGLHREDFTMGRVNGTDV